VAGGLDQEAAARGWRTWPRLARVADLTAGYNGRGVIVDAWPRPIAGEAVSEVRPAGGPPPPILVSGAIPPLAQAYFQRPETGAGLLAGLFPGQTVVLSAGPDTEAAPAAQGGTGKTQLAVEFVRALWSSQAADVLVWVNASTREAVVAGFAAAAAALDAGDPDADAQASAARFTAWLARTDRRWALVLDDVADLADLNGLWPAGPGGQVVVTTRLPGAVFSGTAQAGSSVRTVPVGGFSRREALSYLNSRLVDYADQRIEALDLGEDLDGVPVGLAQAAAVMNATRLSCQEYRTRLTERRAHMSARPVDRVSPAVLSTWSLAAECADQLAPAGLAWPTLALTAMLGPNGIPGAVLTSPAGCGFIAGRPSSATSADQAMVRTAITNLARVDLVSIDPASAARTVWVHSCVQTAVRAYLPPADVEQVVTATADALVQAWPEPGPDRGDGPELDQALRDCALALCAAQGIFGATAGPGTAAAGGSAPDALPGQAALWQPDAHPLLFRLGRSLEDARLGETAIAYWQTVAAAAARRLGPVHPSSLAARDRLAAAFESAGRADDAVAVLAGTLGDRTRSHGPEHPDTIAARGRLAHAYSSAGRPADAVALYEQTVADASRRLGPGHPITLAARADLADAHDAAGGTSQALAARQQLSADCERLLGPQHPATLAARGRLAAAFLASGQSREAIDQYRSLMADHEKMSGPDHPDTIAARASLAAAFRRGGKAKQAIGQYKRVLQDRERTSGADHPDTIAARADLALAYHSADRLAEAVQQYQRALTDSSSQLGPEHPTTQAIRGKLDALTRIWPPRIT
jgi:tetratricopeptide (TPR) repeat protein